MRDDTSVKDKIEEVNEGIKDLCRKRKYSVTHDISFI